METRAILNQIDLRSPIAACLAGTPSDEQLNTLRNVSLAISSAYIAFAKTRGGFVPGNGVDVSGVLQDSVEALFRGAGSLSQLQLHFGWIEPASVTNEELLILLRQLVLAKLISTVNRSLEIELPSSFSGFKS